MITSSDTAINLLGSYVAEELVVYPALEKYFGDRGKQMADHDREEHHEVGGFQFMSSNPIH